jgi:hypothetical protein
MIRNIFLTGLVLLTTLTCGAQQIFNGSDYIYNNRVGVGKQNSSGTALSAWLEIGKDSTNRAVLIPRVIDTVNIPSPVYGLLLYQIKDNKLYYRDKFGYRRLTDGVSISGTPNILSKFDGTGAGLINSQVFDNGTNVGINNTSPVARLDINGTLKTSASADINGSVTVTGNSTTQANFAFIQFRKSNLSRVGYVGDAASFDENMYLNTLNGHDLRFSGYAGDDLINPPRMSALFSNLGRFVFGDSTLSGTANLRVRGSEQVDSLSIGIQTPTERLQVNGNIVANAPNYVSGGITALGRNSTTGRFETVSTPIVGGTVTSVALSLPSDVYNISGSPVTLTGTLTGTFKNQLANLVWASPTGASGAPAFRSLTNLDLPNSSVAPGPYGNDTSLSTVTIDQKGIVQSASTIPITLDRVLRAGNFTTRAIVLGDTTGRVYWGINTDYGLIRYYSLSDIDNTSNLVLESGDNAGTNLGEGFLFLRDSSNGSGTKRYDTTLRINGYGVMASKPFFGPSYSYSSGGITAVGRNNTTGRYETYTPSGAGSVTSVALSLPSIFTVSGSPVTTSGTLTGSLTTQVANTIFSGPTGGGSATPTFRLMVPADIPGIDASKITTGIFPITRGGTGLGTLGTAQQQIRVNNSATTLEYFSSITPLKDFYADETGAASVMSYTVPAGYLANTGDKIKVTYAGTFAATGTSHTCGLNIGSANIGLTNGTTSGGTWQIESTIIRLSNSVVRSTTVILFDNTGVSANISRQSTDEITGLNLSSSGLPLSLSIAAPTTNVTAKSGAIIYYPAAL